MKFLKDIVRTLRVAKRPEPKAFKASLRVVTLGITLLGAIGYLIQLAGSALRMVAAPAVSRDVVVVALAVIAAITLGAVLYLRSRYL
jgi:protein translocase SEC61 complex gamma subunit